MGATRAFHQTNGVLGKDPAVSQIAVTLDPTRWSKRKQNIIVESLLTGVAACGSATAWLVSQLSAAAGSKTLTVTKWSNNIQSEFVKPDKLDDLLAYTSAWLRIKHASEGNRRRSGTYAEESFLRQVDAGQTPYYIPLPNNLTPDEQRAFVTEYMRDASEQEVAARQRIADMIRNGEPITVVFS